MLTETVKQIRLGKITSSIAPACLGLDSYKTPADALDEILGQAPEFAGNKATERGNLTERAILEYGYTQARALDARVVNMHAPAPHMTHPEGWAADSADALCIDASGSVLGVLEAKSVGLGARAQWGEPGTDEVPARVFVQACWHLIHWPTARFCLVPVLFGGYEFEFQHYAIERDDVLLARIFGKLREWHTRHVVDGVPVAWGPGDIDRIFARWPVEKEESRPLTPELELWVERAVVADEAVRAATKERDEARCEVRKLMQDAARSQNEQWAISYRKPKASTLTDWRAVATELGASPELISKHSREVENNRRLTITALKKTGV